MVEIDRNRRVNQRRKHGREQMHISERRLSNAKSIKAHAARIDHANGGL
jgi:hypothetical protein